MTIETAVLIDTLVELGASVRWASCNIFSTQDQAAAAIAQSGVSVFALKGESLEEYWDFTLAALTHPGGKGPQLVVDDGGDATLLLHKGYEMEHGSDWVNTPSSSHEEEVIKKLLKRCATERPGWFSQAVKDWKGVSEETTTGVHRLYQMLEAGKLLVPAINVNDSVTKSKFDNLYGCRESLADGLKRALGGDDRRQDRRASAGMATSARAAPIHCAASARGSSSPRLTRSTRCRRRWKDSRSPPSRTRSAQADIYVTCTGNRDVITLEHILKMKDQAIVCNIGHFDNEIQVDRLNNATGVCG